MEDWLRSIANAAVGPLRKIVAGVSARLTSIWSVISVFLGMVRVEWQNLRQRASDWIDSQIRHAVAVATTLKWLVLTYIPGLLNQLAISVRVWVSDLISKAENKARSLFDGAINWAATHIQGALNALNTLRTWAIKQVNAILDPLARIGKMVFGVLSTPERIATWIVGAMVGKLMDYARTNAHRIESYVVAHRAVIWRMVISVLEDVLSELL